MNKLTSNKTILIQPFEAIIKALKLTLPNRKCILAIVCVGNQGILPADTAILSLYLGPSATCMILISLLQSPI